MVFQKDKGWASLASPGPWAAAERALVRPMAETAAALARLDERLEQAGSAALTRLAGEEAVALLADQGTRLRVDQLFLWRHGAPVAGLDPRDLAAAGWAQRRLAAPGPPGLGRPEDLRRFLGLGAARDPLLDPLLDRPAGAEFDLAAGRFCAGLEALGDLHPFSRAAAAVALWRGAGLGPPEAVLEPAVLAARLAAAGQGNARFLPLGGLPRQRAARDPRAEAETRLAGLLTRARERLGPVLGGLSRRRDWAAHAGERAASLPGRSPVRAVALLAAESLVSANLLRDRLGMSQQAANAVLRALAGAGLIEEVSGQRRYRLWQPRL